MKTPINCVCCGAVIPYEDNGFLVRCARITRGDFYFDVDGEYDPSVENVKFERFVCSECFLVDSDLCAFFNKLDLRIR